MIHNDHLSTPQKMTDASGVVVWSADYKPFGETTVNPSSTITNNLRFPGQYYDAETGLHYNYYRDYDPVIGRYKQADPIETGVIRIFQSTPMIYTRLFRPVRPDDLNPYFYSFDNPLSVADPTGLEPENCLETRYRACKNLSWCSKWICKKAIDQECKRSLGAKGCCDVVLKGCLECADNETDTNLRTIKSDACYAAQIKCMAGAN